MTADIICHTREEWDEASARLLAESNARTGRRRRFGGLASYIIEVTDGGQCITPYTLINTIMNKREALVFLQHMTTAVGAMKMGRDYYVAVHFSRGDA